MNDANARPVIYQLVVRLFGNVNPTRRFDGTLAENGVGKLADINDSALAGLRELGITHVWLTGVLRQATLTDYSALGMPADKPDIVKGRAGSFYAVRDYFDVRTCSAPAPSSSTTVRRSASRRSAPLGSAAMTAAPPSSTTT